MVTAGWEATLAAVMATGAAWMVMVAEATGKAENLVELWAGVKVEEQAEAKGQVEVAMAPVTTWLAAVAQLLARQR